MLPDIRIRGEQDFSDSVATAVLPEQQRPLVFLLGSGVSLPGSDGCGVPGTHAIVEMIKELLGREAESCESYQDAFRLLIDKRRQDAANRLIQDAVLRARNDYNDLRNRLRIPSLRDEDFEKLESENDKWHISTGLLAVASLCAHFPRTFGKTIITTNFDPLIEIALSRQGTPWHSSALHADGSLLYIRSMSTHVVHLHGHWWGSDTLHVHSQLSAPRPQLSGSLRHLLGNSTLAVVGYGGWDDIFMKTINTIMEANDLNVDILWSFYSSDYTKYEHIISALQPAVRRERAQFFSGVSAERALPDAFRIATKQKPAQDLNVFLSRVELVRNRSVRYPGLADPWGNPASSLGDYLALLANLDPRQAAKAALFATEYLLPQLERQAVHSQVEARQLPWVREAINKAMKILDNVEEDNAWLNGAVIDMKKERHKIGSSLNSQDRTTLSAAEYAVCASLAVSSGHDKYSPDGADPLSIAVWAAKSIHASARTIHDDDGALWGYVARRLTGGYDHLWRFR